MMELVARQFLRAIRGRRSQVAFSRRLGYRSNVALRWESGQRFPTAVVALRGSRRVGIDVQAGFRRFHAVSAAHVERITDETLAAWLSAQRGRQSMQSIAERSGLSRYQVSRCLSGTTHPSLPAFFALVDAVSGRLPELISYWVDIERVPALIARHRASAAARECAYAHPWSSAVLALIDAGNNTLKPASAGVTAESALCSQLASILGIPGEIAKSSLLALERAGIIVNDHGQLRIEAPLLTDTRRDPESAQQLRRHWAAVATQRLASPRAEDLFSYNVFAVSRQGYAQLREMQAAYYQSVRSIIKDSEPSEVAALMVLHLMAW